MTRILIRGTKSPLDAVSPERVLDENLIANNSGNLLFLETAFKILSTNGSEVTADRLAAHKLGADEINERFDVYVIPLANAFRSTFEDTLVQTSRSNSKNKMLQREKRQNIAMNCWICRSSRPIRRRAM